MLEYVRRINEHVMRETYSALSKTLNGANDIRGEVGSLSAGRALLGHGCTCGILSRGNSDEARQSDS